MNYNKHTVYYKKISYGYNKIVQEITKYNQNNLDWWVTSAANRNPFVSISFKKYCDNITSEDINENIRTNIASNCYRNYVIRCGNYFNRYILYTKIIIKKYIYFFYEILKRIVQLIVSRITKNIDIEHSAPLILIDVFAIPGFYSKDRYYNGLWEKLSNDEKSCTYFVPTIANTKIKDYYTAYNAIRNSGRNVLIKEDFLNISDVFYALLHFFRLRNLKLPTIIENGVDIVNPIKEELKRNVLITPAIEGILNYRFIRRLKKNNIELRLVVDWWESQALDKGMHLALHHYYPDVPVIGYLGYAPRDLELQLFPTEYEKKAHVIPKVIGVIGDGFVESIKRYYPQQVVVNAPAFRFQHLWEEKESKNDHKPSILVALTVLQKESYYIIKMIKNSLQLLNKSNLDILIKPHPSMTIDSMKKGLGSDWPNEFKIIQGPTEEYILAAKILVTGMSSIALESLAVGKPVIVIENPEDLPLIPIPDDIPMDMWRYCSGELELFDALKYFINIEPDDQEKFKEMGKIIREKYFEPVTRNGVQKFLKL